MFRSHGQSQVRLKNYLPFYRPSLLYYNIDLLFFSLDIHHQNRTTLSTNDDGENKVSAPLKGIVHVVIVSICVGI